MPIWLRLIHFPCHLFCILHYLGFTDVDTEQFIVSPAAKSGFGNSISSHLFCYPPPFRGFCDICWGRVRFVGFYGIGTTTNHGLSTHWTISRRYDIPCEFWTRTIAVVDENDMSIATEGVDYLIDKAKWFEHVLEDMPLHLEYIHCVAYIHFRPQWCETGLQVPSRRWQMSECTGTVLWWLISRLGMPWPRVHVIYGIPISARVRIVGSAGWPQMRNVESSWVLNRMKYISVRNHIN